MSQFEDLERAFAQNWFSNDIDMLEVCTALPDKSITAENGKSIYHLAARYANHKVIGMLAGEGVGIRPDDYDNTPLHALANSQINNSIGDIEKYEQAIFETVMLLIEQKVNPKKKNSEGNIAYYMAGLRGMYPFIEAMAAGGVKMDAVDNEGKNLLHAICYQLYHRKNIPGVLDASTRIIKALIASGLDPEDKDMFDTSALTYAQRSGVKEIAALLSGDETATKTGGMSLEQAVLQRDLEALDELLKAGADINEVSDEGRTALMRACEYPYLDAVRMLLQRGANCNYQLGETGNTATYYLLAKGLHNLRMEEPIVLVKILQSLVDAGLETNASLDNHGNTALHLICAAGYFAKLNNRIAEELLEARADPNQSNLAGQTPLMVFAAIGDEHEHNIAELLLDRGAQTDKTDSSGNNALMYAAGNSNKMSAKKLVELIIDAGFADIEKVNNAGESALDIAVKAENEAVVKLLLRKM